MSAKKAGKTLVFVDSNVLLDMYRNRGETSFNQLSKLLARRESIITTFQVANEFERRRLDVIAETLTRLKAPERAYDVPMIFRNLPSQKKTEQAYKGLRKSVQELRDQLLGWVKSPDKDVGLQTVRKLFEDPALHLAVDTEAAEAVLTRAKERHQLGNPPRKPNDDSIGDAINWEWAIDVCTQEKASLVILTRDQDYGKKINEEYFVNTFLQQEFHDQVGSSCSVRMTESAGRALRDLGESVQKSVIDKEREELDEAQRSEKPERVSLLDTIRDRFPEYYESLDRS